MGSLELLKHVGFDNLWARSKELRDYFKERIKGKFKIISEDSGLLKSLMLAIRPGAGNCWKYDSERLNEYLNNRSVFALVLNVDPLNPWIRIAFPYFLEIREVNKLCQVLEGAIKAC
jgi:selenocysteine lyase/cysteine desulfurase